MNSGNRRSTTGKKQVAGKKSNKTVSSRSRQIDNSDYESGQNTAVSSLLKAVIYIMAVLVVAGFLSYFAITWANDAFALVKTGDEVVVSVSDGIGVKALGEILYKNGVIEHPSIFNLYCKIKGESPAIEAGEYTVSPAMGYDELIDVFANVTSNVRTTVVVTIPEGYTVDDIIELITVKYGISSRAEIINSIQNDDFDYWFVKEVDQAIADGKCDGRKYRLEGYLYPDTYYLYSDSSANTIIDKFLSNFDVKMKYTFKKVEAEGETYIDKIHTLCDKYGFTFDEVIRIASIIQKEAVYEQEYSQVAQVFHNRILRPTSETAGKLESDATIYYVLDDKPEELSEEDLSIDSPYNTRLYKGLTPGPISNPSFFAINDTLFPDSSKSYSGNYYFVTDSDGFMHFAKTYKEHLKNVQAYMDDE